MRFDATRISAWLAGYGGSVRRFAAPQQPSLYSLSACLRMFCIAFCGEPNPYKPCGLLA